ncbi:MAG: hypothetical protein KC656_14915, partial [Myxococcales bacterium]|nr:hypothetical protein [Myxococcales bacterium]
MRTLFLFALAALSAEAMAQEIIINELYRDGNMGATGNEWVELLLLSDLTAAQLEAYSIGDSSSATASKVGKLSLTGMASIAGTFQAGTLLVITGGTGPAEDLSYGPPDDWSL